MFDRLVNIFAFLQPRNDDDFVDRLSYYYTSTLLLLLAIVVSIKQFGGHPLECWVDASFPGGWEDYAEMYCWAQNTYYVPITEHIPTGKKARTHKEISYYQWVPFVLAIQAFGFYIPCILWRLMSNKSGFKIADIVNKAKDSKMVEDEHRSAAIAGLAKYLSNVLEHQHSIRSNHKSLHRFFKCFNLRYYEIYMTTLYLAIKIFYAVNCIGQFVAMNEFLGTNNQSFHGINVVQDLIAGRGWNESGNFPRVTLCDFDIRVLGNVQTHSVQCVLVINILTEKIFILLWFWFSFICVLSVLSLLYWFCIMAFTRNRVQFVVRHLPWSDEGFSRRDGKRYLRAFVSDYVKTDGVFVLRMMSSHADALFCSELIQSLWDTYTESQRRRQPAGSALLGNGAMPLRRTEFDAETLQMTDDYQDSDDMA